MKDEYILVTHKKEDNHYFFHRFNKPEEEHDVQMYYYHGVEASQTSLEKREFKPLVEDRPLVVVRVNGIEHEWDEDEDPTSYFTIRNVYEGTIKEDSTYVAENVLIYTMYVPSEDDLEPNLQYSASLRVT